MATSAYIGRDRHPYPLYRMLVNTFRLALIARMINVHTRLLEHTPAHTKQSRQQTIARPHL